MHFFNKIGPTNVNASTEKRKTNGNKRGLRYPTNTAFVNDGFGFFNSSCQMLLNLL